MIVTGDLAQADRMDQNGLLDFIKSLEQYRETTHIDIVRFQTHDIERHDAVREVLAVYGDE
jgi:phosphate starvation-inducible protein PhoH